MAEVDEKKVNDESKVNAADPAKAEAKQDNDEISKLRSALSKANSEAADWKRQYKATLDEAKQKEMEAAERRKAELEELEQLRAERRIGVYAKKFMEAGFDPATADAMATALPEGVNDTYFSSLRTFNEKKAQEYAAKALDGQKGLSVGLPPTTADAQKEATNRMRAAFGLPTIP